MVRRLVAAALCVVLPLSASAAPAAVKVFEAQARAAPSRDAAVVQTFPEGAQLSVSEEVTDGWRRVRLADGGVAWIEDAAVRILEAGAAAPVAAPLATPAPRPDLRAPIYVKDLDHLAELMKVDDVAGPAAAKLVQRRKAAWVVAGVGIAASTVLLAVGASRFGCNSDPSSPNFMESCGAEAFLGAGLGTALATGAVAALVHPKRNDLLDVINGWNLRHPDQPFSLFGHASASR